MLRTLRKKKGGGGGKSQLIISFTRFIFCEKKRERERERFVRAIMEFEDRRQTRADRNLGQRNVPLKLSATILAFR